MKIICVGIGNTLWGDDGFGPAVIDRLEQEEKDNFNASLLCGGVKGFGIVCSLEGYDTVIFIDGTVDEGSPGQIVRVEDDDYLSGEYGAIPSVHDAGVASGIILVRELDTFPIPKKIIFYGVQADQNSLITDHLSKTAQEAVGKVSNLIKQEVKKLQGV